MKKYSQFTHPVVCPDGVSRKARVNLTDTSVGCVVYAKKKLELGLLEGFGTKWNVTIKGRISKENVFSPDKEAINGSVFDLVRGNCK